MEEYNNITIEKEDGSSADYSVLAIFDVGGGSYVALLPVNNEDQEVVFFGCNENVEDKELELIDIEEDEEFAVVSETFVKLMEEYAQNGEA